MSQIFSLASSKIKNLLYVIAVLLDVMWNKFGHPALNSVFQNYEVNTEFEIAVSMLRKKGKKLSSFLKRKKVEKYMS